MSFCNNPKADHIPCALQGSPMGLSDKACIEVNKVFDACMKQFTNENFLVTLTTAPTTPVASYVSATTTSYKATLDNLSVTPLADGSKCSRVQATVTFPITINYLDTAGNTGSGTANIGVPVDVLLYIPTAAVIPTSIEAIVNMVAPQGVYSGNNTFTLTACMTIILKVIAPVDLLVPTYGYCYIPACKDYTEDVCTGVFELPLYPTDTRCKAR